MKQMKKIVILLLCLSLCASALAGCGGSEKAESTAEPNASAASSQAPAPEETAEAPASPLESAVESALEEPTSFQIADNVTLPIVDDMMTFTMWCTAPPGGLTVVGSPIMEYITQQTNISLTLLEQNMMTSNEKFNLMVASQDYPDIISAFDESYAGGAIKGYQDDVILDLTDLIEENAPNYLAYIQQDPQDLRDAYNDEGQMLFMNGYNDNYVLARGNVIRQDLLDKLGLEIPETYEEYHDVLKAFKDDGIEYPVWLPNTIQNGAMLVAGFGVSGYNQTSGSHFFQKDGKVYSSFLTDEYKEFLQMLNQWYTEGLIASDFYAIVDNMGQTSEADILNGNVGLWCHMADKVGNYNNNASFEGFHAVGLADAVQNKGDISHFYTLEGSSRTTNKGISISVQAENPEVIVSFFDWFFTRQGSIVANYGIEGESYTLDADGNPQYTEFITNNPDGYTFQQVALLYCWVDIPAIVDRDRSFKSTYTQESQDAISLYGQHSDGAYEMPTRVAFTTAESEEYANTIGDIETVADERIARFIIGEYNFEEDWEDFISTIKGMGLERCIELKQAALDRYYQR